MMNQFLPTCQVQYTGRPNQDAIRIIIINNLDQINNGEVGSLYRDGSIGGDSLSEGLIVFHLVVVPIIGGTLEYRNN